MEYIRINIGKEIFLKKLDSHYTFVQGELLTRNECKNLGISIEKATKIKFATIVNINKNKTFFFFGARFAM